MAAAQKALKASMAEHDVLIEILDARLPGASANPLIETLAQAHQRPCLKLLNKSDLADPSITARWQSYYEQQEGTRSLVVSALHDRKAKKSALLLKMCQQLASHRQGPGKSLRLLVSGIPNVGKSTLINVLLKVRRAHTGDEPALTRQTQRYRLGDDISLTDTPGLLMPKIKDERTGHLLAASRAIGVKAYPAEETAEFLAVLLAERYPERLNERYKLNTAANVASSDDATPGGQLLKAIAIERRALHNKTPDCARAAQILLQDFRSGRLGRMSLEEPPTRNKKPLDLAEQSASTRSMAE